MKKAGLILCFSLLLAGTLAAQNDQSLLAQVDALASFTDTDFAAEYLIVHDKPGQSRDAVKSIVFRRDSREQYVIVVMEPENRKGQGYLKQEDTLWFYDPDSRRFNSTSSRDRFQNSNAGNSDFTRSTLARDYRVVSGQSVMLGRFNCRLLDLEAINDNVPYPYMRIWVDENNLVRKTEDYSLSRQLLRTTAIPSYQNVGSRFIPKTMLIEDALAGAMVDGQFVNERTQITISRVSLESLPDSVFTKSFLEQVSE